MKHRSNRLTVAVACFFPLMLCLAGPARAQVLTLADDAFTTVENQSVAVPAPGVLANDTPVDNTATLTATVLTQPGHGSLTFCSSGGFTYAPEKDYYGTDSFTYSATDGVTEATAALVLLTIAPNPTVTVNDVTMTEGDGTPQSATFVVTLNHASNDPVTVTYESADGSAVSPADYAATSGNLTFPPGTTSQNVPVALTGNTVNNANFFLNLTDANGAAIGDAQGVGSIIYVDPGPTVSVGDASVVEGNSGLVYIGFPIYLSKPSLQIVTVRYATSNGTALSGEDYYGRTGTITLTPGMTRCRLSVQIRPDTKFEPDETFYLNLSDPQNATIDRAQGTGTIINDDPQPSMSINDVTVFEGNFGTTAAVFTVSLTNPSYKDITVNYATADGTATAPSDYTALAGTLTIPAGYSKKTITVWVIGDTKREPNETFTLNLSSVTNASLTAATGHGLILNDD